MKNLNENIGGKIEIEFQDWLDTMNDKDYPERLTLETVIEYSQDTLRDYDLDDWVPQGQSTSESKKMKDFDLKKYLAEGKLLKEDDLNEISRDAYDRMEGLANENKLNELKDLIMILGEDWANEGFENGDIVDYLEALVYQLVRS